MHVDNHCPPFPGFERYIHIPQSIKGLLLIAPAKHARLLVADPPAVHSTPWSNWISSARPFPGPVLSNCMSMSVLSQSVPSGAVPWACGSQAGLRDTSASFWLPNMKVVPNKGGGGALGGPCWPSSAQLPNKEVSGQFAHGLPHLTNIAVLPNTFSLACMPIFRAWGAPSGPGQPGVNFAGSRQL
eukprot:1149943-Pelagomonas_calceolata.AAC.1